MVPFCKKCGEEGHTQEHCVLARESCYKCGKSGHIAGECSQIGRFALRHQIYENSTKETKPSCQHCREEGHWTENCNKAKLLSEKRELLNKYQEVYKELRQKDPIASMDETVTEYPSQDYHQIDKLIEERRVIKEQTPKRNLNMVDYQPRRLVPQNKIELGMPRNFWTPHRDTALHEIYPIPEDEEENRSNHHQTSYSGKKETTSRKEGSTGVSRDPNPPTKGGQGTGGSAGAPGGGGGRDEPSNSSSDNGPNWNGDEDSEEENDSSIASARLKGQRGRPGPMRPHCLIGPVEPKGDPGPIGPRGPPGP